MNANPRTDAMPRARQSVYLGAVVLALATGCAEPEGPCAGEGVICRLAGTGVRGFNGDGHPADRTSFYLVSAVRRGPDGRIWIMDFNNHLLRQITDDGRVVTMVGSGMHDFATVGGPALESALENPIDFGFLPDGSTVLVAYHDSRILRVNADGILESLAGALEVGIEGDGGPASAARFVELTAMVVGPDGSIIVSDDQAARVRVLRPDGIVDRVAGTRQGYAGDGGPAVEARFRRPTQMSLGADGSLFVADTYNHVIRRIDPEGMIETVVGTGDAGFEGDDGPATSAQLRNPGGVAVDADGTLYVADTRNHRIRQITPDGIITTIAGTGEAALAGDGGPAIDAALNEPSCISLDGDSLLIADYANHSARALYLR